MNRCRKNLFYKSFLIKITLSLFLFFNLFSNVRSFEKVVIWGYKLYSHTNSYVHYGFFKAFKELGYDVFWFDDLDDVKSFNFENSLFLTLGPDKNIPLVENSIYILHNCFSSKYSSLKDSLILKLQTLTQDCFEPERDSKQINNWAYYDNEYVLYFPWATDLLPSEIDENIQHVSSNWINRSIGKDITFVGTVDGFYIVEKFLMDFAKAAKSYGFSLNLVNCWSNPLSIKDHIEIIKNSSLAPALQGSWQCQKGYIPCRIFKNISYGHWGITNNYYVYELFNKKITYDSDPCSLLLRSYDKICNLKLDEQIELMKFVRDNHTYINRVNVLLQFINILEKKGI